MKHSVINYAIALVWLINGLYCKILHQIPRHEYIVERLLGANYAEEITKAIGVAEVGMAVWIVSKKYSLLSAIIQIVLIAAMNIMEFFLASDLLLFGKANLLLASLLILVVYYNEWINKFRQIPQTHK